MTSQAGLGGGKACQKKLSLLLWSQFVWRLMKGAGLSPCLAERCLLSARHANERTIMETLKTGHRLAISSE